MRVVFLSDVENVGQRGEEKEVKPGYARNFLFLRGLAVSADSETAQKLKSEKNAQLEKQDAENKKIAEIIANNQNLEIKMSAKSSPEGKLFGGINPKDIIDRAEKQLGVKINKINPSKAIKVVGSHKFELFFSNGIDLPLTVIVVAKK